MGEMSKDLEFFEERGFGKRLGFGNQSCLIVVDAIKGFTNPAMPMGSELSSELKVINDVINACRDNDIPVIFTTISYDDKHPTDGGIWIEKMEGLKTLKSGTDAVELDDRLLYQEKDSIIVKKYASAFFGTDLASRLNASKIDTIMVTGFTTSGCIRATAVDGVSYGFRPIVIKDAVADRSQSSHEQSLFDIEQKYGDVLTKDQVIQMISKETV